MRYKFSFVSSFIFYVISFGLFNHDSSLDCATYWHLREQDGIMQVVPGEVKKELIEADRFLDVLLKANPPKNQNNLLNFSNKYNVPVAGVGYVIFVVISCTLLMKNTLISSLYNFFPCNISIFF